jgi:DNA polymerase-3 subunit gamma/tau
LGLLKLIQAQRLLPLEELLSGATTATGAKSGGAAPVSRSGAASAAPSRTSATMVSPSHPPAFALPPSGAQGATSTLSTTQQTSPAAESSGAKPIIVADATAELAAPARPVTPFPAASSQLNGFAEALTEGSLAKAPAVTSPQDAPNVDAISAAVVATLAAAGHASASQLLGIAAWIVDGASVRIEVPGLGKKMLALTVNAAAEKIIRQELQRLGAPTRFMVVPGEGSSNTAAFATATLVGSVQEAALANPMVQRARDIFNAEVRSVLDLRGK